MKLEDVLDDLCARFIINLPEEERSSFERLGFQIEQAFWFYDDFYRPMHPHLPRLNLRTFGETLMHRYPPLIAPFGGNFDELYEEFISYKHAIPVCGAIILNDNFSKCLLVKGWSSKATWGFPKGKIGKNEEPLDCAVREVYEEIGFDISDRISINAYIDAVTSAANSQNTRLFIVPGVPESTNFSPQTRKEISKIQWHRIDALPTKYGQDNSYYNVINFVNKLKQWIKSTTNSTKALIPKSNNKINNVNSNNKVTSSKPSSKKNSPKKTQNQHKSLDIFDKLRLKNDNSPINSVLMRDNPSPIHLFKKLSINNDDDSAIKSNNNTNNNINIHQLKINSLISSIESFASALKSISVDKKVIVSCSINKF